LKSINCGQKIQYLEWLSSSKFITSDRSELTYWDFDSEKPLRSFKPHETPITCLQADPSGALLATASQDIKLWSESSDAPIKVFKEHKASISCLAWLKTPSQATLASGGQDCLIKIWSCEEAKSLYTLVEHRAEITCLAFDPTGKYLASGDAEGVLVLWAVQGY